MNAGRTRLAPRQALARPVDYDRLISALQNRLALARGVANAELRAQLEPRAAAGDAEAALLLGLMLQHGDESARDTVRARALLAQAAAAGFARAMTELGRVLLGDESQSGNIASAETWLRRAWAAGDSEAALLLGAAQRIGILLPPEGEHGDELLRAAANAGNLTAQSMIVRLFDDGAAAGFSESEVVRWLESAAERNDEDAIVALAYRHFVAGRFDEAARWLQQGAEAGSVDAITRLVYLGVKSGQGDSAVAGGLKLLELRLADAGNADVEAWYAVAQLHAMAEPSPDRVAAARRALREAVPGFPWAAMALAFLDDGVPFPIAMQRAGRMEAMEIYVEFQRRKAAETEASGETGVHPPREADPVLLAGGEVPYPQELVKTGVEGMVIVEYLVGLDGSVGDPSIVESPHPALSAAALETVKTWNFRPARKDGAPVVRRMRAPFRFHAR